jgi:protease I
MSTRQKICLFLFLLILWVGIAQASNKVVMVIAHNDFRDEELFETENVLENKGIKVTIATSKFNPGFYGYFPNGSRGLIPSTKGLARGMLGGTVKPDILIDQINVDNYDAIVFVGGIGASEYWESPIAHKIIKEAMEKKKVIAAICIAPVTLAKAGILKGKRVTSWHTQANKLANEGAIYTGKDVEVDGLIVTATGPGAAKRFGEAILKALGK